MAAQRLLGCRAGSARYISSPKPRARFDACEWSAIHRNQDSLDDFLTSTILGVVDMDIYGAFQFCSIGILAAPLTVRLSRTYFYDPGRNIIFLWTILILMGLVRTPLTHFRPHCAYSPTLSFRWLCASNSSVSLPLLAPPMTLETLYQIMHPGSRMETPVVACPVLKKMGPFLPCEEVRQQTST